MGSKRQNPGSQPCHGICLIQRAKLSSSILDSSAEGQRACRVRTSCPSLNHWSAPLTFLAGYLAGQAVKAMTVAVATAEISEQTLATTVTLDSTISHEDRTDSERLDSSVQFSRSVVPNSLQPHGLQHARPPWRAVPFWPWFITGGQEKVVIQGSSIM